MNSYPYIIQGNNIIIVIDNKTHTVSSTHISYQKVLDAIKAGDWDTVKNVIDTKKVVLNYGNGNVSIHGDKLFWRGQELVSGLAVRMIQMYQEGFSIEPMVHFMENLMQNPSRRAVLELYGFLEKNNLPITPDGHFLAYKKVRTDYKDCHTGTMDNHAGSIVEMQRNDVDDNCNNTCSTGLHFCSLEYLKTFVGARTMIVKINPRDVVSIPVDYNNSKGRTCRYEVIGELEVEPEKAFTKPVQPNANFIRPMKTGSTEFYRGYTDGYNNHIYDPDENAYDDNVSYDEGYNKGQLHNSRGEGERYRYLDPIIGEIR